MTAMAMTGPPWAAQPADRGSVMIGRIRVPVVRTPWGVIAHITPEIAGRLLGQNRNNRHIRKTRVELYLRDILAGRWPVNGETLVFAPDGDLLQGQHRLMACVQAGVAFESYIIGDIPEDYRWSFDSGLSRTVGDVLGFVGESNATNLGAAITVAWKITTNGTLHSGGGYPYPTRSDLNEYLARNLDIRDSVKAGERAAKSPVRMTPSIAAGLHHLFAQVDADAADDFFARLASGADLAPDNAVLVLRNVLLSQIGAPRRLEPIDIAAITIKAWNAWRSDRPVKYLRWRRRGKNAERFPEIAQS
jgi:hypothetical protein